MKVTTLRPKTSAGVVGAHAPHHFHATNFSRTTTKPSRLCVESSEPSMGLQNLRETHGGALHVGIK
jgi:hypothetical protein